MIPVQPGPGRSPGHRFALGRVYRSAGASLAGDEVAALLEQHVRGAWNDARECRVNEFAVAQGLSVVSVHRLPNGTAVVITTAADRSHTTVSVLGEGAPPFLPPNRPGELIAREGRGRSSVRCCVHASEDERRRFCVRRSRPGGGCFREDGCACRQEAERGG